jgi:hypothetical protein
MRVRQARTTGVQPSPRNSGLFGVGRWDDLGRGGCIGRVGRCVRAGLALALGLLLFSLGLFALALLESVIGLCQSITLLAALGRRHPECTASHFRLHAEHPCSAERAVGGQIAANRATSAQIQ